MVSVAGDVPAQDTGLSTFERRSATRDPAWVKWLVLGVSLSFFALFIVMPLLAVFVEALRKGWTAYFSAIIEPDAFSAIRLTLLAAAIAVPLNLLFGVAAPGRLRNIASPAGICLQR
jgi:sulfate transport system permease protein